MLEDVVEPEPGRAEGAGGILGERGREGEHDRLLALVPESGFSSKAAPSPGGPFLDLRLVGHVLLEGEQGTVKCVHLERKKSRLFDQAAGLVNLAVARRPFGELELCLFLREFGFLLLVLLTRFDVRSASHDPFLSRS